MNRVNIYLTQENTKKLNDLTRKYAVSKSTIAVNVLFYLTKYLNQEQKTELREKLGTEYLEKKMGKKTCIKPQTNASQEFYKNLTKAYTNALWMYLNKDIKNYLNEENTQKFYNDLNKSLQITNEPNWDYNHFIRQMARYKERTEKKC